jgi:hypothetical protein
VRAAKELEQCEAEAKATEAKRRNASLGLSGRLRAAHDRILKNLAMRPAMYGWRYREEGIDAYIHDEDGLTVIWEVYDDDRVVLIIGFEWVQPL